MAQDSSSQQKQGEVVHSRLALLWWTLGLGFCLFVFNVAFIFLVAFSTAWGINPNLGELTSEDPFLDFKFFLLISLLCLLAGMLLGRSVGKMNTVVWVCAIGCLIGSGAMVAVAVIMLISGIGAEAAGDIFFYVAAGWAYLIGVEEVFGVAGAALGGLIGSCLLHKRSASDGKIQI